MGNLSLATAQVITTIAGGGGGDGAPASNTSLHQTIDLNIPLEIDVGPGVAIDTFGNIYVTEKGRHRIRKIDTSGIISTIAGNGTRGFSGDGGAATIAQLDYPSALAIDSNNNLFVVDGTNLRVRKIDINGIITSVAGTGAFGFTGDGDLAINAQISPTGIALDNEGDIYITDVLFRIRKINKQGIISTIAGTGEQGYSGDGGPALSAKISNPYGIIVDKIGNIFFADSANNAIRKIDDAGQISTISGNGSTGYSGDGGPARNATLNQPEILAFDDIGDLFFTDAGNNKIRRIDTQGIISTIAGNGTAGNSGDGGTATKAEIMEPGGLAFSSSNDLYFSTGNLVRRINSNNIISTIAGNSKFQCDMSYGGPASTSMICPPNSVNVDSNGNIYFSTSPTNMVFKIDASSGLVSLYAGTGEQGYYGDNGLSTHARFFDVEDIISDLKGNLYVADSGNNVVRAIYSSGLVETIAGNGSAGFSGDGGLAKNAKLDRPIGLWLDSNSNFYIADSNNQRIRKVDSKGIISTIAGNGKIGFAGDGHYAISAELRYPSAITMDEDNNIFIADSGNYAIRKIDQNGIISTVAGNGVEGFSGDGGSATDSELNVPAAIAIDANGSLFIVDAYNFRVRKVDAGGIITTVAGDNFWGGYEGDGVLATSSSLSFPSDISFDSVGNMLIADGANMRIRMVSPPPVTSVNLDQHGLTGAWYTPATSGQGLVIQVYPDLSSPGQGVFAAGWYTYDATVAGGQRWYTLQGKVDSSSPFATVGIYEATGGIFSAPPVVQSNQVGTATLNFSDCQHGNLAFNFTDGSARSGVIPLTRLDGNTSCSEGGDVGSIPDYISDAWYDPETSGQGFFFDINPVSQNLFLAWYTYAPSRDAIVGPSGLRWFTIQAGGISSGLPNIQGASIYETTGGTFNAGGGVTTTPVGLANVHVTSCISTNIDYSFTDGSNAGLKGTVFLRRIGPTPSNCAQ